MPRPARRERQNPARTPAAENASDFAVRLAPDAPAWQIKENSLEELVKTIAGWMEKIAAGEY